MNHFSCPLTIVHIDIFEVTPKYLFLTKIPDRKLSSRPPPVFLTTECPLGVILAVNFIILQLSKESVLLADHILANTLKNSATRTVTLSGPVASRVDSIYGNRIDRAKSSHPSIFSSWSLESHFTRLLEKTTCWSISV